MLLLDSIVKVTVAALLVTSATALPGAVRLSQEDQGLAIRGDNFAGQGTENVLPLDIEERAPVKAKTTPKTTSSESLPSATACSIKSRGDNKASSDSCSLTVPTVTDFIDKYLNIPKDGSMFWAGPGDYEAAAKKKIASVPGLSKYKVIADMFTDQDLAAEWTSPARKKSNPAEYKEFWDNASKAMAEGSKGVVYVILPKGQDTPSTWYKGTVWDKTEFKYLKLNKEVEKLYAIHPEDTEKTDLTSYL